MSLGASIYYGFAIVCEYVIVRDGTGANVEHQGLLNAPRYGTRVI
jgi:hypothetical protein